MAAITACVPGFGFLPFSIRPQFTKPRTPQASSSSVSVLEVSQTGDRDRIEEIQSLVMTARVGGFVDWPRMREVSWTALQAGRIGGLGGSTSKNQYLGGRAVAGFVDSIWSSSGESTKPPTQSRKPPPSTIITTCNMREGAGWYRLQDSLAAAL